jgi:hypothetical protein
MSTNTPSITPAVTGPRRHAGRLAGMAQRHPVAVFLTIGLGLGGTVLTIPDLTGQPNVPYLLGMLVVLVGAALLAIHRTDGPGGVRRLLARGHSCRGGSTGTLDTRGSLLAVGLQHAAFSASGGLGSAGWEYAIGLIVLTGVVAGIRHVPLRRRSSTPA